MKKSLQHKIRLSIVFIYDRFGVLLYKMDNNEGWNGISN
jgi:hypothetical protein